MAGHDRPVRIPPRLRTNHTHLIGRPDKGKSTLEEHRVMEDILGGDGVAVLDPHGDLVQRLLRLIPQEYADKVIYFDLGDPEWVPLWNPLERVSGQDIGRMADDLIGALKSLVAGWGDRMEHILRHCILALLHLTGRTFLNITDILRCDSVQSQILRKLILDVVESEEARQFWQHDFKDYHTADLGPAKHKLSKLLAAGPVSLMLSQPHSAFNFQHVMDDGMIFPANLSSLGTEVRGVLGGLLLTAMHTTALARSRVPPEQRQPFHIYLDEAHRFVTDSLEDIERSKSKGYHAWMSFADGSVTARKARLVAGKILAEIERPGTEVFPKQDVLREGISYGNFINAPLFGALVPMARSLGRGARRGARREEL